MKDDTNPITLNPETGTVPDKEILRQEFESKADARVLVVRDIERYLGGVLLPIFPRPTVKARTKSFKSYYSKHLRQFRNGVIPPIITDLMGIRIICPFIDDLAQAEVLVQEHFEVVEVERKGHYAYKEFGYREFGYESTHLLVRIPPDIARVRGDAGCDVVEIQIRTTLQDAWAEVEHEIFYKADFSPIDRPMKRKLSAVKASLSLADIIFQEIRSYQSSYNSQLVERRKNFYNKIEESIDAFIPTQTPSSAEGKARASAVSFDPELNTIDDMLLSALTSHNNNQFDDAIAIYTGILELNRDNAICALIYKHRGIANFANSKYNEAISDFTEAFKRDDKSHISVYYRGVVRSVLKQYAKAIDDFTLSLKINPYQSYCLFRRSQAYYHIGDYPQALSDCDASLSMEPSKDVVQKFRELIQERLKM